MSDSATGLPKKQSSVRMPIHRLYVCTTCVRDKKLAPSEISLGRQLAEAVECELSQQAPTGEFDFLKVSCLNGCLSPCNMALRCSGKYNLRFSGLTPNDANTVIRMLSMYLEEPLGDPDEARWPARLRGRRTVHTAPPHLLLSSGG